MRRLVFLSSTLTVLTLCALVASSPARAGRADIPSPANSTIPAFVTLVGHRGGVPDPAGEFVVVNRDLANNPIVGAQIVCDFSWCRGLDFATQQPYPGLHVDCLNRIVWAFTDVTGTARFRIVGGASNPGGAPACGFNVMRIYADGMLLGRVNAAALDQNGFDGVRASDLSSVLADILGGVADGRSDFDGNGVLAANDLSVWVTRFVSGDSSEGAASLPGGVCP